MDMDPKSRRFIDMVVRGGYTGKPSVADPLPPQHGTSRLVASVEITPVHGAFRTRRTDPVVPTVTAAVPVNQLLVHKWTFGMLFQAGGWWIGIHYSKDEKRFCLNLIPCLTIYAVRPGGNLPKRKLKLKRIDPYKT